MAANPFTNLGTAFQSQQDQAGLAQLLSEEQFKQIQALNDPTNNLALAKQTADARAGYPTIDNKVEAFGPADGLLKGLNQGMANRQKINAYKQQVQAYQGIQNQYQQNQAQQRELVMGQIAAHQQRDAGAQQYLQGANPGQAALYPYLDPAQRQSMLGGIGTKELNLQYAPREGTAEGLKQVNKGQAIINAVNQMPPVEVGGIPQAAQVDARHNIQGFAPTTSQDVNSQYMDNQKKANDLHYQPGQLQDEAQGRAYDLHKKEVDAQYAQQEKELLIKRDQLANQKGTVDYNKALDEYKRFDQGQQLFKTLQESGTLDSPDPYKQSQIQAQLGIYGISYNHPNAPYGTTKDKTGAVWQVDNATGHVRPLIDKNGKPVAGEWHIKQ